MSALSFNHISSVGPGSSVMADKRQQQALHEARTRQVAANRKQCLPSVATSDLLQQCIVRRYLEQACLRREIEDLLNRVQYVLQDDAADSDAASGQADAKLQETGIPVPAAAAISLERHLQAAFALQRLQLPAGAQQCLHSGSAADITNKPG